MGRPGKKLPRALLQLSAENYFSSAPDAGWVKTAGILEVFQELMSLQIYLGQW